MKRLQIILGILLLLTVINSTHFFLNVAKVQPLEWLIFNACAPSSITFLLGLVVYLITGNRMGMHIAVLPMLFFGGLGLFFFPWSGYNIIGQISHIIMVLNIIVSLIVTFRSKDFQSTAVGLLLGIIIFNPFICFQQTYVATHPDRMLEILGINFTPVANPDSAPNLPQKSLSHD